LRLIRSEINWDLPDAEVAELFVASRFADQRSGRGNRLVTHLGEFFGSESVQGGLQSVLVVDEESGRSFEQVIAAVTAARPDRLDWIDPPTKRSRRAAEGAHRTASRIVAEDRNRAEWVRRAVDAMPPFSEHQKETLRRLLGPASQEDSDRRAAERKEFILGVRRGEGRLLGGTGEVRLWWDRRIDRGWALTEQELADRYLASRFADLGSSKPAHESLYRFVAAGEYHGGLQSAWVIDANPAAKAAHRRVLAFLESQPSSP